MSLKYSLAKEMDDKAKQMKDLKDNPPSEPFSLPKPPPNLSDQFSSKDVMDFKSRESIFNSLFEAIKDGKNRMVGLYGIGGSGKTTLAIEVGKKVERLKLFDKVVPVVVSRPLNVRNIQEQIKGKTGLKFEENIEAIIAARLLTEFKRMKILIILDDVWSDLNLQEIGIPINENCRVLLTTRRLDVCRYMGCEENFELPLLIEEEAWDLLKMHANRTHDSLNEFVGVGKKIVDECKGLPIAIVTVGRALRGRGILDWKRALWRLQQALPLDIDESSKGPYACLKLSYDYLPTSLAKQLFLLCSMFPEDHQIHREDLIRFAKGTLKFEGNIVYAVEDARREILVSINSLLDSCLLMHTNEQACLKMHDLVRDVALWIAREQHQAILVDSDAVSKMLAENGSLKETKVISLWNLEGNCWQSNQLHCPTLEVLLLHPKGFIEDLGGIEALKILVLATSSFQWEGLGWHTQIHWSMPQSIVSSLINLHTLCLRGIALGDISFLGQLKGLEILDLRGSQFDELPIGIVGMKKLKLLDVFGCEIEKSPFEVIGRCEQLEELYFWEKKSAIPENFSLSRLKRLKRYVIYNVASLSISRYLHPLFLEYCDTHCIEELRAWCIQGFKVSVSDSSMKDLILRPNCLWLDNCRWDLNDINCEIKHLAISCCVEKRFIADNLSTNILQTGQVFSHLISLRLINMNSLEGVFQDSSITCSLLMLQELFLERCPELGTYIFTHATVTSLPKLRKLEIEDCSKLKWLFSYSLASQCPSLEELLIKDCPKLERLTDEEDAHGDCLLQQREALQDYPYGNQIVVTTAESSHHSRNQKLWTPFLSLKYVDIERSGMKGTLFEVHQVRGIESIEASDEPLTLNSELRSLHLSDLGELEYIWKGPTRSVSLYRLKDVALWDCSKLRNVFTLAIVTSFPELKTLRVQSGEEWKGIFCEESLESLSSSSNVCFPKLEHIDIWRCHKMKRVFSYSMASHHCPSLEKLNINDCSKLERVLDEETAHDGNWSLPLLKLKELDLQRVPKLREIFGGALLECPQHKNENKKARAAYSELCSISLDDLEELEYIWKGPTQSVSLHRLDSVHMWNCSKLRNIFTLTIVTSLPELKTLLVDSCEELEGIFCEESLENLSSSSNVCFPKLENILIWRCNKMKRVFSYSMASHHCPSLENLEIEYCSELEGVVDEKEAHDGDWRLPLLKLKELHLRELPKLRDIFGRGLLECPQQHKNENKRARATNSELCSIVLRDLEELEYIWKGSTQSVSLYRLEENLEIDNCSKLEKVVDEEATHDGDWPLPLLKLKQLSLTELPKLREIFGGGLLECQQHKNENKRARATNSELCYIFLRDLKELEYIWKGPTQSVSLHRLGSVDLWNCPKLRNIFTLAIVTNLPELERLEVGSCEELEGIFCEESLENLSSSSNVCFPKLETIEIWMSHKMKRVFSYSMASHHCPSLEGLGIGDCSELERVVDEEAAHDGDWRLPLLKLKKLDLRELPKLRDIFGGGFLECPQHKNENERARGVNSELCFIYLEDIKVLECIWKGPIQSVSLHKLEDVTLTSCPKLRNVFTVAIVTSLPELRSLKVSYCEEWEGIFCDESLRHLSSSNVCFPKLEKIEITACNKVKWLFSSYCLASHCPSLERIHIKDCSEFERVVKRCEGEVGDHKNLFPKLKKLSLINLPKLREIYEGYEFNFLFGTMHIQHCPNIILPVEYNASSELETESKTELKTES
ncbi:uncharacterized protein LOC114753607 [Neltuma alba]|uniref:uncharacterized protein LOC114753607 n=1 Tax=Neltuma alba TaxID=207710 RepID=UPI0010A34279|nr:uncharacterized protein LOC114753607 [Prosopis alba]